MHDFALRAYTKKELALMYFPYSTPAVAVHHLMAWIRRCEPLWRGLLDSGHNPRSKGFTPREVEQIVARLGVPKA